MFAPPPDARTQTVVRWRTSCNPYRLVEALSQIINLQSPDLKVFEPLALDEESISRGSDGIIVHTNVGPFLVSYRTFSDKRTGKLRFPGRQRLLPIFRSLRQELRSDPDKPTVNELQQLILATPLGDIYLDLEKIGANDDRFVAVISEEPINRRHIAYLIEQTSIWWVEEDEAVDALESAIRRATEFLCGDQSY